MEKVIVTGANGFLGTRLINSLSKKDIEVFAIDIDFNEELKTLKNVKCFNCQEMTLNDIQDALSIFTIDCIFHLAWKSTSGELRSNYNVQLENIGMVCEYILFAKKIKCKRFIYASSINEMETYEYFQSDNIKPTGGYIYGTAKMAGHFMGATIAYQNDIEFIPIIITNIYGVGENSARLINTTIRNLLNGRPCSFTEGKQTYDFIYISDAINSIIEIAKKGTPFSRYYLGSGHPKPLRDFLVDMRDIVNPQAKLGFGKISFNGKDISYNQFELNKVFEDTNYSNQIDFKRGIELTMNYIKEEG